MSRIREFANKLDEFSKGIKINARYLGVNKMGFLMWEIKPRVKIDNILKDLVAQYTEQYRGMVKFNLDDVELLEPNDELKFLYVPFPKYEESDEDIILSI